MATKPNSPGLFGKFVQRWRTPAAELPDAGESVQQRDSKLEKVALQDRIESRRRDDLIRRKEFGYLRKVRAQSPRGLAGILPRPSLFANSSSFIHEDQTPQDRARTVKKIDAIEAHMAQLWAQKKLNGLAPNQAEATEPAAMTAPQKAATAAGPVDAPTGMPNPSALSMDLDFTAKHDVEPEEVTQPANLLPSTGLPKVPPVAMSGAPAGTARTRAKPADGHHSELPSDFHTSLLTSMELGDDLNNPALQEAAIRFADGDDAGAEAALLSVVQAADAKAEVADTCSTALLDLYRATDQATSFEEVAIEYAQRFGRSPPEWFSMPQRVRYLTAPSALVAPAPSGPSGMGGWECPADLSLTAVQTLQASQRNSNARHVRWDALRRIQADAALALTGLFGEWAALPLDLHFSGGEVLNTVLQTATPLEDPGTAPLWWHLRLEALRIQGRHDDFESVALDYCVVYEVSPPSWLEADCTYVHESQEAASADTPSAPDTLLPTLEETSTTATALLDLRGEILGDAEQALNGLRARVQPGAPMVVSLANVIRVDFSAAGSILNWLTTHEVETGTVQFVQVPRLVAAFFQVMGIAGVARVSTVKNG